MAVKGAIKIRVSLMLFLSSGLFVFSVWIGSLAIALSYLLSPLASILSKSIGCRLTAITGGVLCVLSLLISSYSSSLALMYFTYSFLYGLGVSFIYLASLLITAKNFRKNQALAVGIVSVGESAGVLIFGPILQSLVDLVGWRGAFRIIIAFICFGCILSASFSEPLSDENESTNQAIRLESDNFCCTSNEPTTKNSENVLCNSKGSLGFEGNDHKVCAKKSWDSPSLSVLKTPSLSSVSFSKERIKEETSKLLDFSVFKFPRFSILIASFLLMCFGHFTPQLHLVKHCLELGISADSASKLFIFIGLTSSVARFVTGRLCDISWVNPTFVYQFGVLLVGFITTGLPIIKGYKGILMFAIIYGVGDGIIVTTMNTLLMFSVDEKYRAAAIGLGSSVISLGIAGGPPLAGFLADQLDGYSWSFRVAGILMLCAGILPVALVWLKKEEAGSAELQNREAQNV